MTLEIATEGEVSPQELAPTGYFRPDGLVLPKVMSGQEVFEVGYEIKLRKRCSSLWLRQWREYVDKQYGEEFTQDTEQQIDIQVDLALGLPSTEETAKPKLNEGLGKGTAIVTIEGLHQGFSIWRRKMDTSIPKWTTQDRKKACELLRPMVEFYDYLLSKEGGAK
jgi:hypothetical protein